MKTKNIIVFILVLAGLLGLMWWSKPAQTQVAGPNSKVANNVLIAEEKLYDFGSISMTNGNVAKTFKITNPTDQDITIKAVSTSCMCTTAYLESASGEKGPFGMPGHGGPVARANEVIKAGESRAVRVVYDPNAHGPAGIGPVDRLVYLEDAAGGVLELEIKAMVRP